MPIHDWNRVLPGIFHDFHNAWIQSIKTALNHRLPPNYYALSEQVAGGFVPDVLTLQRPMNGLPKPNGHHSPTPPSRGGVALKTAPPVVAVHQRFEDENYLRKTKTVTVRHSSDHRIVAVIEIVSSGNKRSAHEMAQFVKKSVELIVHGIHLLVIDLFPPGPRDPAGTHGRIWNELTGEMFTMTAETPLALASYRAVQGPEAFVEPTAVGKTLIDMPLFYDPDYYIPVPLEQTYMAAWDAVPEYWRNEIAQQNI